MPNKLNKLGEKPKSSESKLTQELESIKSISDGFRQKWDNEILKLVNKLTSNDAKIK